jgi:branched-chain amino acid transport system substrate-binding protein
MRWRLLLAGAVVIFPIAVQAQDTKDTVKIGVLGDMSGLYADVSGRGAVEAAKMAAEDYGNTVLGKRIEIVSADHQNKPDIAAAFAARWYDDDKVDMITDVVGSGASLAVAALSTDRKKVFMATNGATSELNGKQCAPFTIQYRSDTYAEAKSTVKGLFDGGGDTWFIIAVDYALGHSLQKDTTDIVTASGGKVLGAIRHPLGTTDFSSYILAAQTSGAKVIALADAGGDMVNGIKSASEFGLTVSGQQRLTGLLVFLTDIHAVGLKTTQGLVLESDFYWDMDDRTRDWSERFFKRVGMMPNMTHAATYSAVTQYLKAIDAVKSLDAATVIAQIKKTPIDDLYARHAYVRDDGLLIHDLYVFQVKKPEESKRPWDYYKLISTIPGEQAFRPLSESECPLLKRN